MIDIGNPAHVHLYKNIIWQLEKKGHNIKITSRAKETTCNLLDLYGFKYQNVAVHHKSLSAKFYNLFERTWQLYKVAKEFKPNLLTGVANFHLAHVGKLLNTPSIIFTDTETVWIDDYLTFPFADVVITPENFQKDIGKKHIRVSAYKELAYLHPNWFTPNPEVLDILGISKNEKYVILRFSAFDASHDIGIKGFSLNDKRKLVKELEKYGRAFISSETILSDDIEKYAMKIPPHKIHDVLYYASMYIGEGGTMASEAAVLGTPSILINSEAKYVGVHQELRDRYGLQYFYSKLRDASDKISELLETKNVKSEWARKRARLLNDKLDVTAFMIWFIENYPKSVAHLRENPEVQDKFISKDVVY